MKQLILNQVTLCADGSIGIQWLKQVTDPDSGEVLFSEPHRTVVDFDGDAAEQVDAVRTHLATMGYSGDWDAFTARVQALDAIGRGDPAIEAVRAAKLEQRARFNAEQAALAEPEPATT